MNGTSTLFGLFERSTIEIVNILAYMFIIVIGGVGNIWVVWKVGIVIVFGRSFAATVPRSIIKCILVLCIADLLVLSALALLVDNYLHGNWRFGEACCKVFYGIEILNKFVIPLTLVQISIISNQRSRVGEKTTWLRRVEGTGRVVAGATVISLLVCVVYFSQLNVFTVRRAGILQETTICNFNPPTAFLYLFNGLAFIVGYLLTTAAYVYFYISVPLRLQRRCSSTQLTSRQRINPSSLVRTRRTVTAFISVFLLCWSPYWVFFWLLSIIPVSRFLVILSMLAHILPYVSCTVYPIMLTAVNRGIRSAHSSIMDRKMAEFARKTSALQAFATNVGVIGVYFRVGRLGEEESEGAGRRSDLAEQYSLCPIDFLQQETTPLKSIA